MCHCREIVLAYQNPYIEQQPPLSQFPHTVLPLSAPQEPSVVTAAVDCAPDSMVPVGLPITGSPVVEGVGGVAGEGPLGNGPFAHPLWQPFCERQWSFDLPQYLHGLS